MKPSTLSSLIGLQYLFDKPYTNHVIIRKCHFNTMLCSIYRLGFGTSVSQTLMIDSMLEFFDTTLGGWDYK